MDVEVIKAQVRDGHSAVSAHADQEAAELSAASKLSMRNMPSRNLRWLFQLKCTWA